MNAITFREDIIKNTVRGIFGILLVFLCFSTFADTVVYDNPVTLTIEVDVSELRVEERDGLDIYRQEDTDAEDIPDTFIPLIAAYIITENPVDTFIASCSVEIDRFSLWTAASPEDSDKDHIFDDFNGEMDNCPQTANPAFLIPLSSAPYRRSSIKNEVPSTHWAG